MNPSRTPQSARTAGASALAFAAVAFVAVGAVAWIGLDAVAPTKTTKQIYSAAPPKGTANQIMMALKAPHRRTNEKARLALLEDEDGPMVVKPLDHVVELTQIDFTKDDPVPASQPEPQLDPQPEPLIVASFVGQDDASLEGAPFTELAEIDRCFEDVRDYASGQKILFATGSSELQGVELSSLLKIGRMVEECPTATAQVTGHSDSSGPDLINLALSWERADNTVAALAALGVDTTKFEPVGFGARSPYAQGDSSEEVYNRRVEFHILPTVGG